MDTKTIDPNEVAYYERLANQWWDKQGKFWPLHRLNELRTRYIKDAICEHFALDPGLPLPLAGIKVIDIGCGGGILSESMATLGAQVHGIDVVEKSIRIAQQHSKDNNLPIRYEYTSVYALAERGEKYDVVLNMEVVEHVADMPAFLADCAMLVDRGGMMFVATINRNPISWLFAIIGAEYILGWLPKGTHQWNRFVKPQELESIISSYGLRVDSAVGVRVNPLNKSFSLSDWLGVNYMLTIKQKQASN